MHDLVIRIIKRLKYLYGYRLFIANIYRYGIRYLYDKQYRRKMKRKKAVAKYNERVGGYYLINKKRIKQNLFRSHGNICFWCRKRMRFYEATIDHIIPVSKGGSSDYFNLRLLHDWCRVERDGLIAKGLLHTVHK